MTKAPALAYPKGREVPGNGKAAIAAYPKGSPRMTAFKAGAVLGVLPPKR